MDEVRYIKYTAVSNGYKESLIDKMIEKHSGCIRRMNLTTLTNQLDEKRRIRLHFAPIITNKFKSVFKQHNTDLAV